MKLSEYIGNGFGIMPLNFGLNWSKNPQVLQNTAVE